jgi:hypothetical protein
MTTIFDSAAPVKSERPFGTMPARERRQPYTAQDLQDAAQMFADAEADRELEERALQARWDDQFTNAYPAGCCQLCGEPSDQLDPVHELCPECLDRAEFATIASVNERAGLGYRVF